MNSENIHNSLKKRVMPVYSEEEVTIRFANECEYNDWVLNIANNHAVWIYHINHKIKKNAQFVGKPLINPLPVESTYYFCDHSFSLKKKTPTEAEPETKRRRTKESKKIGCTARYIKYLMTDNSIEVLYKWQHVGHDPSKIEEVIKAGLPADVKEWLKKYVEQDFDWKQIKRLLRLDEMSLDEVSNSKKFECSQ